MADTNTQANTAAIESTGSEHTTPDAAAVNQKSAQTAADNAAHTTNEGAEKTFTQKELDEIVRQRLERAKKDMPSKERLKALKDFEDSQKTAEQLSAEKITAAETAKSEAEKRAETAEAKCAAYSKGGAPEAVDDVIALAMSKVSDDVDISKAIDMIISKYPSFCKASGQPKGITTSTSFGASAQGSALSGVEACFLKKNPGIKID